MWKVREGRWRPFAKTGEEERSVIHAECAGISELMEDEREGASEEISRSRASVSGGAQSGSHYLN